MTRPMLSTSRWLGINLGLAALYAITGNLGLHLAISSANITAAWPPSGLALAAVLIFGNRVLPGIFLGSFLVNGTIASGHLVFFTNSPFVTLSLPIGAVLQALLGAALIRRAGAYPSPLDEPRDVGRFLLLGGPVACLLGATWGVTTLWIARGTPDGALGLDWWTWWVGDSIGVLAFTPVALVWGGEPRAVWRKRRLSITLSFLLTFAVAVALFLLASRGGHGDWKAWLILALGLLFSALLGAFLLTITGRTAQVDILEALVAARTEDMNRALRETEARSQELEDLNQTVQAINQEMNLKGMLDALLRALLSQFPQADVGVFLLKDETDGHFRIVGLHPPNNAIPTEFHLTQAEALARYTQGSEALGAGAYLVHPQGPVPKPPRAALGAPGGSPQERRDEHSGSTRFEPDAVGDCPPPQPEGTAPGGRSAVSAPLTHEPHGPAGPSLRSIPPDAVAAHGGFGTGPQASTAGQSKVAQFTKSQSLLVLSVEIRGALAGFLVLDNMRDPDAFRAADVAKLHRFREHIISALNKLRTLHDLERAKEMALAAARAKSHFLANMSHEIRTPMNAILGFAGLGLKQDFPPKAREYFQKIANSGKSLLGVINDVLDFSKIEAGKLELESVPFDLPELLGNTADLFAHMAMEKNLELIVSAGIQVPRQLVGDPLRLGQVLTNLTGNALKFTEHGQVHVRVDVLEKTDGLAHLHFAVSDSGIGISPEQQAHVFSAFSQADSSNTRRFGGTGLGLSISKRLVELMGGELFVQSEFGVGSTFAFSLHLPFDPAQPDSIRLAPGDLIGLRVLVVDDNDIARTVLVEQLRAFGFEVKAVPSAETALEVLASTPAETPFGLILLDWRMPEMDGVEALRRIQALPASPPMKIVLCTAFGQEELRRQAEAMEVAGFLSKPLSSSRLLDGLLEALGREAPSSQSLPSKSLGAGKRPNLRGAKVLLVEDIPINQQVASEILASEGIWVQVAGSGLEAIHAVDHGVFDAVLMDIQMPDMDGYETTARIRERSHLLDLPIIAMTAHALPGYREECLAAGMNDFLTKPVEPDTLFRILAQWVEPRKGPPEAPVTPGEDPQPTVLPDAPGFDVAAGLRRLGGKATLYLRLVADFARDYPGTGVEIRTALAAGDRALALRLAHTLKGVAGNLNATQLQVASGALEKALGDNLESVVWEALAAFEAALALALEGAQILGLGKTSSPDSPAQAPPSEEASTLMEELQQRLSDHDPRAEDSLERLRIQLRDPSLQPHFQALDDHLASYDFKGAAAALKDLQKALKNDNEGGS